MSRRYERVNTHDDDEPETPVSPGPRQQHPIPNSPPPSFHSRGSSIASRDHLVDPALADAFDSDEDDSDDEADDRQRLVRGPPAPTSSSSSSAASTMQTPQTSGAATTTDRQTTLLLPEAGSGGPATPMRVYGGGIQSDGVFSNLSAKPELGEGKEEQPPTYEQAAADAAPPYWETTILAPGLGGPDEVYIDGMPVGSIFSFVWNAMISMFFQLPGFLLTYLLHSTHAAKNGSLAGLGVTLIQNGFNIKAAGSSGAGGMGGQMGDASGGYANPPDPNSHDFDPNSVTNGDGGDAGGGSIADIASSDWVAYILMILGWFILIRAASNYLRTRRHEQLVLQSPDRGLGVAIIAEGENPEHVV